MTVRRGTKIEFGLEDVGINIGGRYLIEFNFSMGTWAHEKESLEETIGYYLRDESLDDTFDTKVYIDKVYGTLLFIVNESGSYSSDPHEPWTQSRHGPSANSPPRIVAKSPEGSEVVVEAGNSRMFFADAVDDDEGPLSLSLSWIIDGEERSNEEREYRFWTDPGVPGLHVLVLDVSDGTDHATFSWRITVRVPELLLIPQFIILIVFNLHDRERRKHRTRRLPGIRGFVHLEKN